MGKVLDLKMPGVQELGREELKEVDGGIGALAALVGGIAFLYLVDVASNLEDHIEAFKEGYNQVRNE